MPEIISRKEAVARGLKRYFTGKPCKLGHVCERVRQGTCVACAIIANRKYVTENPQKVRDSKKNHRLRNPNREEEGRRRLMRYHTDEAYRRKVIYFATRYSMNGPINPTGEKQWLRKSQATLKTVRRILRNQRREATNLPEAAT